MVFFFLRKQSFATSICITSEMEHLMEALSVSLLWLFSILRVQRITYLLCFCGEGNGNPLQYSCLENPMDGGAWWAMVHGVAKSWTRMSNNVLSYIALCS